MKCQIYHVCKDKQIIFTWLFYFGCILPFSSGILVPALCCSASCCLCQLPLHCSQLPALIPALQPATPHKPTQPDRAWMVAVTHRAFPPVHLCCQPSDCSHHLSVGLEASLLGWVCSVLHASLHLRWAVNIRLLNHTATKHETVGNKFAM